MKELLSPWSSHLVQRPACRPSAIYYSLASKPRLSLVSAFASVFHLGSIGCANPPQVQVEFNPTIAPKNTPVPLGNHTVVRGRRGNEMLNVQ